MRFARLGVLILLALFVLIQFVPYGRDHTNPPVLSEPAWDSARTRELAVTACFDCHSNETIWPWYSNVAPISWLVYKDTIEGRETLNYSEWASCKGEGCDPAEARESILDGEMPLPIYLPTHPEAGLSDVEKQELIDGLFNSP
jgi:hypothetical protein